MLEQVAKARPRLLLNSETLWGYGLDLVFRVAKDTGFDWIDLAIYKSFDAWNTGYVKDLIKRYDIPVCLLQVSNKVNLKEMNKAVDLAQELGVETIVINAPKFLDLKTETFVRWELKNYKKIHPTMKFAGVNWAIENFGFTPIPQNRMTNITEIIKKYGLQLWIDLVNLDETTIDSELLKKMWNYIPYIEVVYLADKTKLDKFHAPLWEWNLKLQSLLKKFKQNDYERYFSLKLDMSKKDLADIEKVEIVLTKCINYFHENYTNVVLWA